MQYQFCAPPYSMCEQMYNTCTMACSTPVIPDQSCCSCYAISTPQCCPTSCPNLPCKPYYCPPYRPTPYEPLELIPPKKCCKPRKPCKLPCCKPKKTCRPAICMKPTSCCGEGSCFQSPTGCNLASLVNLPCKPLYYPPSLYQLTPCEAQGLLPPNCCKPPQKPCKPKCCKPKKICRPSANCFEPTNCCAEVSCYESPTCCDLATCCPYTNCCSIVKDPCWTDHCGLKCYVPMETKTTYRESYVPMRTIIDKPFLPQGNFERSTGILFDTGMYRHACCNALRNYCCCCNGF